MLTYISALLELQTWIRYRLSGKSVLVTFLCGRGGGRERLRPNIDLHLSIWQNTCLKILTCVRTYVRKYIHTCIHTYIHTHAYHYGESSLVRLGDPVDTRSRERWQVERRQTLQTSSSLAESPATYIHTDIHKYINKYIHAYTRTHTHMHACMHTYLHTSAYIHQHIW